MSAHMSRSPYNRPSPVHSHSRLKVKSLEACGTGRGRPATPHDEQNQGKYQIQSQGPSWAA
eukprot:6930838-Pyramimonas_sp.AAC.2